MNLRQLHQYNSNVLIKKFRTGNTTGLSNAPLPTPTPTFATAALFASSAEEWADRGMAPAHQHKLLGWGLCSWPLRPTHVR